MVPTRSDGARVRAIAWFSLMVSSAFSVFSAKNSRVPSVNTALGATAFTRILSRPLEEHGRITSEEDGALRENHCPIRGCLLCPDLQTSTCSAIAIAPSTSMPQIASSALDLG